MTKRKASNQFDQLDQILDASINAKEMLLQRLKSKQRIDVPSLIPVHMIFNGDETKGWVHTHGMWDLFEIPDIEILGVNPLFLMPYAGRYINHFCQYLVDGKFGIDEAKPFKVDQTFATNIYDAVKVVKATVPNGFMLDEIESHYKTPRWRMVEVPGMFKCAHKGCKCEDRPKK